MKPPIYFLVRAWNCYDQVVICLNSILAQQDYSFKIVFIDDASDYSSQQRKHITKLLESHIVIFNRQRRFAVRNAYDAIHTYMSEKDALVINVDGDDWLTSNQVLKTVWETYQQTKCDLTYGDCQYYQPNQALHQQLASQISTQNHRYPAKIEKENDYRRYFFLPLHLRTWRVSLFKKIHRHSFLRPDGTWLKTCEDQAMYLPMLEMVHGNYQVINKPLYMYNLSNPLNDAKANMVDRLFDEVCILKKPKYQPL